MIPPEGRRRGELEAGAAARGKGLLTRIDACFLLESCVEDDLEVELPPKVQLGYSMTKVRKQKILCQQLNVVKFLLDFMPQAHTANWADGCNLQATRAELDEAQGQWKALKEEYLELVEKTEAAIPLLLDKLQQLKSKKSILEEALSQYHAKAEVLESLQEKKRVENMRMADCVKEGHQRVHHCEEQIQRMQDELERHQELAEMWLAAVTRDSEFQQLIETLCGVQLVSICEQEMVLDVQGPGVKQEEHQLKPLRLTLHWTPEDKLQIQTDSTVITAAEVLPEGGVHNVKLAILEMQNAYRSQAGLLQELQALQERFPIDWRPKERKLLYLKGNTVCVLHIDPSYPTSGGVQLLSLQGPASGVDIRLLKPPFEKPTLCNWLVYLCSTTAI